MYSDHAHGQLLPLVPQPLSHSQLYALFFFFNLLTHWLIYAVHVLLVWGHPLTYKETHPYRKLTYHLTEVINCQKILNKGWSLISCCSIHSTMLVGLILNRPYAGNHSCCEFTSTEVLEWPEDIDLFWPSQTSDSCSPSAPYFKMISDPWELGVCYRCTICGRVFHSHSCKAMESLLVNAFLSSLKVNTSCFAH